MTKSLGPGMWSFIIRYDIGIPANRYEKIAFVQLKHILQKYRQQHHQQNTDEESCVKVALCLICLGRRDILWYALNVVRYPLSVPPGSA